MYVVRTHLFPGIVGNGSKWGVSNGAEGKLFVSPYAVLVLALLESK